MSAKVIDTSEDQFMPDEDDQKKRIALFGFIAFMMVGAGMALTISAKYYWANEALTINYPGHTLTWGTVGICLSGFLFKFFRTHEASF